MCTCVAVPIDEIPLAMIRKHHLASRIARRSSRGGREIQFRYLHPRRLLPVYLAGQLRILEWGCRVGTLPRNGWCHSEWIESGLWQPLQPEPATIVAALALDRGLWFQVKEGIKCVVVRNHVYMLTEPATRYYQVMTRSNRMPIFIGQTV
jgi:hypothetical protein